MTVLGLDIGASTVDIAVWTRGGVHATKVTRRAATPARDIAAAVAHAADIWAFAPDRLEEIRIGSTGAINMLLARTVARVGLIATSGFADTMALARQNRAELYDPVARSPAPTFLVMKGGIHEVGGRLDGNGCEIEPVSIDDVGKAGRTLAAQGAEAIAVCLLFSHANPSHERRCAEILAEVAPGIPLVLSHAVDPQSREYERTVSTCLEAALWPSQQAVLAEIESDLRNMGFAGRLSFADSRGNLLPCDRARAAVSAQVLGGPAASAWSAGGIAKAAGAPQALAIDIGSTTTDIVLVADGAPALTTHGSVAGVPVRMGMADIESIALGGGSKVRSTPSGLSFTQASDDDAPSLTDALVVLSELSDDLAPNAVERLSMLDGVEATHIREAALDAMAACIVRHAVSRNVDPASVPLIVAGGLGTVLGPDIAKRLGTQQILAGSYPAMSGAMGLLLSRHVHQATTSLNAPLAELSDDELRNAMTALRAQNPQAANGQLYLIAAPSAFMHPVRFQLAVDEPDVAYLRAAFADYHMAQFASAPREAGFAFSLSRLRLEPPLPAMSVVATPMTMRTGKGEAMRAETLQMRLNAIAQSMQEVLFRTAVSPVVREGNDAAAGLLTPNGELIALSDAIPLLLGALDGSIRALLDRFPIETMRDGDLYLMNDPFLGGTHLPDLTVMRPVFVEKRLIGFAASILHHQDVGGMRAGSVPPDAVDIFQEGLRLPPMRMGAEDAISRETIDLIQANSRAPDTVLGDLSSQVSAAVQAAAALRKLALETGVDAFISGMETCLERGEKLAARTIASMAPGPHVAAERLDATPGLPEIKIQLALSCVGGRFVADFAGTSPQVAAPINCVRSGPFAAAFYSLLSAMEETMFRNGGVVRTIDLSLPTGCVINASSPAAVNARMGVVRATTSSLLQGLAKAMPQRMPAANSGMSYVLAFSGTRPDGQRFIATEIIAGGAGGGPDRDGASGISTDVGNAMNMPAEALESQIPVRLHSAQIRHGSGGGGRFRGGDGIRRTYIALQEGVGVSLRGERFIHVPQGAAGGGSPEPAAARVVRADGVVEELASRSSLVLNKFDRLIVESCGGAGYGLVSERSPS